MAFATGVLSTVATASLADFAGGFVAPLFTFAADSTGALKQLAALEPSTPGGIQ